VTRLAAVMLLVAFFSIVLGVAEEELRFLLVVAAVAIVIGVIAGFRGRTRSDVKIGEQFDGPA
jgi:low temperature requirement protein LtrA